VTALETARLLAEVLAILGILGTGFLWIAKNLWKTHTKLDGENTRLDVLNGSVARHEDELAKQRELNAYLKGTIGVPLDGKDPP
jgi:hypothetical protein